MTSSVENIYESVSGFKAKVDILIPLSNVTDNEFGKATPKLSKLLYDTRQA